MASPRLRRRLRWLTAFALLAFAALNASAWMHAGAMTRWADEGSRTPRPEELGWWHRLRVLAGGVRIPRPVNTVTPASAHLVFETVSFPNGRGDELEAWLVPAEDARAVAVVLHGYAGAKSGTIGIVRGLHELGCTVLSLDFHGSGGSSGAETSVGIHEAHDVAAAAAWCRTRIPGLPVLLYGQSMGGAAALRAVAVLGVQPDGLALEGTFDRFLSTVKARFHRTGLPATPLAHLLVLWGNVRVGANAFAHDPVEYARAVRCPTLVLQGDSDPNITPEQAGGIHAALGGWKRLSLYTKTGHEDLRTADRERWARDVGELLAEFAR